MYIYRVLCVGGGGGGEERERERGSITSTWLCVAGDLLVAGTSDWCLPSTTTTATTSSSTSSFLHNTIRQGLQQQQQQQQSSSSQQLSSMRNNNHRHNKQIQQFIQQQYQDHTQQEQQQSFHIKNEEFFHNDSDDVTDDNVTMDEVGTLIKEDQDDPLCLGISSFNNSDMLIVPSIYSSQFNEHTQEFNAALSNGLLNDNGLGIPVRGFSTAPQIRGRSRYRGRGRPKLSTMQSGLMSPRSSSENAGDHFLGDPDGSGDVDFSESGLSYKNCPICQKKITYNHLKRHIKTQHTDMQRVSCPFCYRLLKNCYSLETHIANYHK